MASPSSDTTQAKHMGARRPKDDSVPPRTAPATNADAMVAWTPARYLGRSLGGKTSVTQARATGGTPPKRPWMPRKKSISAKVRAHACPA